MSRRRASSASRSPTPTSAGRSTTRSSTRSPSRSPAPPRTGARCIVLTGEGRWFSSGYDIGDIPADVFAVEAERIVAHPFTEALQALDATDLPTLAAINGPAIGGGLEFALACDLRVAAQGVQFGMPPAKLGLVYSHTGIRRFIDAIGAPRARELFLVGRRISPETALAWGLVNDLVEPEALEAASLDWASELAGNAPLSVRGNKQVFRALLAAQGEVDAGHRARAGRAARGLLLLAGHARGRARVRREAPCALAGPVTAAAVRVCTWNVNSLRARLPRVLEMLEKHAPDVVLLQETKVAPDQYPDAELQAAGLRLRPSQRRAVGGRRDPGARGAGPRRRGRRAPRRDPRRRGALDRGRRPGPRRARRERLRRQRPRGRHARRSTRSSRSSTRWRSAPGSSRARR